MLAHLAVFLLIMLIACTLSLLICWAYDTDQSEIGARHSSARSGIVRSTTQEEFSGSSRRSIARREEGTPAAPERSYDAGVDSWPTLPAACERCLASPGRDLR